MSRLALMGAVSAAAGLVLTIGVAWIAGAFADCTSATRTVVTLNGMNFGQPHSGFVQVSVATRIGQQRRMWDTTTPGMGVTPNDSRPRALPELPVSLVRGGRWGRVADALDPISSDNPWRSGVDIASGWPCRALWCATPVPRWFWNPFAAAPIANPAFDGGIPLRSLSPVTDPSAIRALPFRPIWHGLALDTAFYAGIFAAGLIAPRAARRTLRRRRGLCPACGYSLAGLTAGAPCPECGPGIERG